MRNLKYSALAVSVLVVSLTAWGRTEAIAGQEATAPTVTETPLFTPPLTSAVCTDVLGTLADLDRRRGTCAETWQNQEPIDSFAKGVCRRDFETHCPAGAHEELAVYLSCLQAVPACNPESPELFDEAIDACLDRLQNSHVEEACYELIIGD